MSYQVHTQTFTGPFDLLLNLVSRQKVDIATISISEVADQYLAEVAEMPNLDLDVASDFILVASTLLDMKAASLVAADDNLLSNYDLDDDDPDDLAELSPAEAREVLIARLITYKQFRNAAANLASRMSSEGRMYPRTAGPDPEFVGSMPDFLEGITLRSLAVICADLDSRREQFLLEADHIAPRRQPVRLAIESVRRLLVNQEETSFSELVGAERTPETVVVTFLALLELFKRGMVDLEQDENFAEIEVHVVEGAATSDEDFSDLNYEATPDATEQADGAPESDEDALGDTAKKEA